MLAPPTTRLSGPAALVCALAMVACPPERPTAPSPRAAVAIAAPADASAPGPAIDSGVASGVDASWSPDPGEPPLSVASLLQQHPGAAPVLVDGYVVPEPHYRCPPCPPRVGCSPCPPTREYLVDTPDARLTATMSLLIASNGRRLLPGIRYHLVLRFHEGPPPAADVDFATDLGFGAADVSPCDKSCNALDSIVTWGDTPVLGPWMTYQLAQCRTVRRSRHGDQPTPDCFGALSCDPGTTTVALLDRVIRQRDVLMALGQAAAHPGIVFGRDVRAADGMLASFGVDDVNVLVGPDCADQPGYIPVPPGLGAAATFLRLHPPHIAGCE